MSHKKGQTAIFIIVAVMLVLGLTIFFFARSTNILTPIGSEFTPDRYMESCMRDAARQTLSVMLPQGGIYSPTDYLLVNQTPVAYLCKNINYYDSCVNHYPTFIRTLESELRVGLDDDVERCLDMLEEELERRDYAAARESFTLDVDVRPELIDITLEGKLSLEKNSVTQTVSTFDVALRSSLHEIGFLTQEIVAQEAQYCYFEYVGYMILYPEYDIRVTTAADATKLYTVTHLPSETTLQFAVRGCALPAGI